MFTGHIRLSVILVVATVAVMLSTTTPHAMRAESACVPPSTALALPLWHPTAADVHGARQFTETALIEFPATTKTISAELWGGGGGGGGGAADPLPDGGAGGGGGASGSYTRGVVVLDRTRAYIVVVGDGGTGGAPGTDGSAGYASEICEGGTAVLVAAGGPPGAGARASGVGGTGGHWDEGDMPPLLLETALEQPGHDGSSGQSPVLEAPGAGGSGGAGVRGMVDISGSGGGQGGRGATRFPADARPGDDGQRGAVVIEW